MSGRLLRSAWWPLLTAAATSLALAVTLWLRHARPGVARDAFGVALAASAVLSAAWVIGRGSCLVRALWRARVRRRGMRRVRMQAQRTIIVHFPPAAEALAEDNAGRLNEAEAELRAHGRLLAALAEGMDEACKAAGIRRPDAEKTAPMLRLVGDERDSA